jgi:hypothetical protein
VWAAPSTLKEKDMCDIEPCGYSDPDRVERDLQQLFRSEPYYHKLIFIPQRKMPVFLKTTNPTSYLRISVDPLLLTIDEMLKMYEKISENYDFQIVPILRIAKGTSLDELVQAFEGLADIFPED